MIVSNGALLGFHGFLVWEGIGTYEWMLRKRKERLEKASKVRLLVEGQLNKTTHTRLGTQLKTTPTRRFATNRRFDFITGYANERMIR